MSNYLHLRAWGRVMHSNADFIREQVALAKRENAPGDAVYRQSNGEWVRFADVASPSTRSAMHSAIEDLTS